MARRRSDTVQDMRYDLLALDLDGTLLDPYGALCEAAAAAVAAAREAGLQVVACTGRRFRTALPLVEELRLEGPVVVNNGTLVKDIATGKTLHARYLSADLYPEALALIRSHAVPLVYVDTYEEGTDFLTERSDRVHPFQLDYLEDHGEHCRVVDDLHALERDDLIMLSTMADARSLRALQEQVAEVLGSRVRTHTIVNKNYDGMIFEIFSAASGKWQALRRVAAAAGIQPDRIAAIGDDHNDLEMLSRSGLGIAMGNAVAEVREAADLVVRSNAEGGVIEAIETVLQAR